MEFQYLDGMFLGKQELERIQNIEKASEGLLRSLLRVTSSDPSLAVMGRPINPKFSHLKIESRIVGSAAGVAVGLDPSYDYQNTEINVLGRGLIGLGIGAPVLDSDWTGKEGWTSIGSLSDGTYYVQIKGATVNFENALISVDTNGLCTFSKGWKYVQNLFRNSDYGRQTRIYITGANRSYAISSVNTSNHTVQLVGEAGSFTALTDEKFRFVPTMSPFIVSGLDDSIYTYNTLEVQLSNSSNVPSLPWYTVGSIVISSGAIASITLFDCETEDNKYGYLDTVSENQINTRHLIDGAVTEDKLASGAVTTAKLASDAVTNSKIADFEIESIKLAKRSVGSIDVSQNQQYELMPGQEVGGVIIVVDGVSSLPSGGTNYNGFVKFHSSWGANRDAIKARLGQSIGCWGSFDLIFKGEPEFPCNCQLFDDSPDSQLAPICMPARGTTVPKGAKVYGMRINYVIVSDGSGGGMFATFGDAFGDALSALLNPSS